jgi:hypothetical protein
VGKTVRVRRLEHPLPRCCEKQSLVPVIFHSSQHFVSLEGKIRYLCRICKQRHWLTREQIVEAGLAVEIDNPLGL